jgi:hypothetical protein
MKRGRIAVVIMMVCGTLVSQAPPAFAHNCDTSAKVEPRQVDPTTVGSHAVTCGGEMYKINMVGSLARYFKEDGRWVLRGLDEQDKKCSGDNLYRCQTNTYLRNRPVHRGGESSRRLVTSMSGTR